MAFYFQYRNLGKRVKQQLDELDDREKGQQESSPRFSGATAGGEQYDIGKDSASDDENGTAKNFPYAALDGIALETDQQGQKYYQNPKNWSLLSRMRTVSILVTIAFVVTAASSIDSAVARQAAMDFRVSEVTEALGGTAIYLIGFGVGALLASPASEMVGRYPVYLGTLIIFGCWLIGAGLAPNIGAQIAFRFLAGLFGSPPLTVAGGSITDMFTTRERIWAFPIFAIVGFGGPVLCYCHGRPELALGRVDHAHYRWPGHCGDPDCKKGDTRAPASMYKARHLRKLTGDDRFKTVVEAAGHSFAKGLKANFTSPFILALEPIVLLFTLYLAVVYIILFTFLDGYTYIFQETYGVNQGISNLCFLGLLVGILMLLVIVPLVNNITTKQLARDGDDGTGKALNQGTRIIFSIIGASLIPLGLFWMGWTDYSSISVWSPLVASAVVGFGIISIFTSAYLYIIDSYHVYAASALTFVALVRYLAAGGMTVVGIPMYKNLGTHWTLTVLACISIVIALVPYVLYVWGHKVRGRSKYAVGESK
ncbi:hypothetical protein LTR70_000229 [Exophiala xenobiotica]|uniref:Major facilitator superfamily (MFS) profile domain-containing protein n=1 Tax=Lithohypha guttulata TaxID=1690604 RepID=A0ABR0K4L3_9EURO|nr:hypothetical protein LTR24_007064 [Lithohypha guttulata]KAK5330907.1 hypothetical protein LTR70_000229 [Exophiala xenobiotica]